MKHISIRVPWHDNKWNGTICQCPKNNPFCMMLHNISERKDEKEKMRIKKKRMQERIGILSSKINYLLVLARMVVL